MYGLPHQSTDDLMRTIARAETLAPDRVALFGYAHVPWMKTHQKLIDTAALPGAAERLAQADAARLAFLSSGYDAIGLDHFARHHDAMAQTARAGALKRNFQGYTVDAADALIGFGASAIGKLPQGYIQNAPDFGAYDRAIDAGQLATVRGLALTEDDRFRADLIERLMCDFAVDIAAVAAGHGLETDVSAADFPELSTYADLGIITRAGDVVTVTEAGRPYLRLVATAFDAHLKKAGRHSVAV
jgi:oxygen-independent coproporphyrinogen-3 oxidase